MQLAQDGSSAGEPPERAFLSPGKAFALLFGVILLLGAGIFLLRPDAPAEPTPTSDPPAPTFELTNAEAIARFEQLDALREVAYRERDPSLVTQIYVSGSPVEKVVIGELRQLRRDDVRDETRTQRESISVVKNDEREIVIEEVVVLRPRFVNERGRDVTEDARPVEQVRVWTLREQAGTWLVYDAVIRKSRFL